MTRNNIGTIETFDIKNMTDMNVYLSKFNPFYSTRLCLNNSWENILLQKRETDRIL